MPQKITTLVIATSTGYITDGDLEGNFLVEYDPQPTKPMYNRRLQMV